MTQIIVSGDAEADIFSILDYLEEQAGAVTAQAYGEKFADAIERLVEFPDSGVLKPALGDRTRAVVIYPYVLIYDYLEEDGLLFILRVLHAKRKVAEKFLGS